MVQRIALVGASGRMGQLISELIADDPAFELVSALRAGDDLSRVAGADIVIDVSLPQVSPKVVDAALAAKVPVLVGTSGWSAERIAALRGRVGADSSAVWIVPNFSIGSVLATAFAEQAARWFDSIEIVEAHHAGKADSPSGTAMRTAERMAAARAETGPVDAPHVDQRARGQQIASIPVHSIRLAGVVAKQEVLLGAIGEVLTISHEVGDRHAYAAGIRMALRALSAQRGVVVGLEHLLLGSGDDGPAIEPIADQPSGQAATATSG